MPDTKVEAKEDKPEKVESEAPKETAEQCKQREAAEKEAQEQAEQDAADIDAFWASWRGHQLVLTQNNGSLVYADVHAQHQASKAVQAEEEGKHEKK